MDGRMHGWILSCFYFEKASCFTAVIFLLIILSSLNSFHGSAALLVELLIKAVADLVLLLSPLVIQSSYCLLS